MGSYTPNASGLKELATSAGMGSASLAVARSLAGNAGAVGRSTYEAANTSVAAGWRNELRAGAVVREVSPDGRDARDAILLRVIESMAGSVPAPQGGSVDPGRKMVTYTRRDGTKRQATQAQADHWNRGY